MNPWLVTAVHWSASIKSVEMPSGSLSWEQLRKLPETSFVSLSEFKDLWRDFHHCKALLLLGAWLYLCLLSDFLKTLLDRRESMIGHWSASIKSVGQIEMPSGSAHARSHEVLHFGVSLPSSRNRTFYSPPTPSPVRWQAMLPNSWEGEHANKYG